MGNLHKDKTMKDNLLNKESRLSPWLMAMFVVCAITGFAIFNASYSGFWQSLGLLHFASGLILGLVLIYYVYIHFVRTLGMRRPLLIFSGIFATLTCLALIISGLDLAILGNRENRQWMNNLHFVCGLAITLILILHLILHWAFFPEKRKSNNKPIFLTLDRLPSRTLALSVSSLFCCLAVYGFAKYIHHEPQLSPLIDTYEYSYGPHPFRPSQTETHHGGFIPQEDIADSEFCADCHADIAAQWLASAHRQAASDKTYVSNVTLLEKNKGIDATRYCEGCHAPIALLTGELTLGGKHGGIDNTPANTQGISCTSCHRITSVVHTKGVASYEFTPASDYLFANSNSRLAQSLNRFLIRSMPELHKQEMALPVLSDPKICASCHAQFMDADMNGWGWVKMQDEYSAWLNSPFAAQHEQRFASSELKSCHDCHMPLVKADDPSADANGMVKDHRFLGANTMLAVLADDDEHLMLTERFLQNNKMRISIEKPYRKNPTQNLQALNEDLRNTPVKPWYFYKNEEALINVIVSNVGVGHDFPGGTVDINQAWVHFQVTDAEGHKIYESGAVRDDQFVDPEAYFYRSLPVDRKGQLVWKHDLFNKIGEVSRNTVKAGESDVIQYRFNIPGWAKSPLMISTTLNYRKLNQKYALWALKERYEELPITEMARAFLQIVVRDQLETQSLSTQSLSALSEDGSR